MKPSEPAKRRPELELNGSKRVVQSDPDAGMQEWRLVERARHGDLDAFGALVRRYQQPVVHFCHRMLSSVEDAEDVAQETFVRLYRYLDRLEPGARFSTVLFGIARNLALNHIRDAKRRGRGRKDPLEAHRGLAARSRGPDEEARLSEIGEAIKRGLAELSPEHREVLVLREINGLDYESIARVLDCRIGTVKSRIARARDQLHARIRELGGGLL